MQIIVFLPFVFLLAYAIAYLQGPFQSKRIVIALLFVPVYRFVLSEFWWSFLHDCSTSQSVGALRRCRRQATISRLFINTTLLFSIVPWLFGFMIGDSARRRRGA